MDKLPGGFARLVNTPGRETILPLMGFGTYKCVGDAVLPTVDCALKTGYRLIDTAQVYGNEKEIGDALKTLLPKHGLKRSEIFLTTKLLPSQSSEETLKTVEESLSWLKTDYIDLVLIHYPKPWNSDNEDLKNKDARIITWKTLEKLYDSKKICSIGVSNFESNHIDQLLAASSVPPAVNQMEFHPHMTRTTLREYCKQKGVHFQAFTSLARNDASLIEESALTDAAKRLNATPQQVLLAWAMAQGVSVIPKSQSTTRIISNYDAVKLKLTNEEIEKISALNQDKKYTRCEGWLVA